jgi:hypothetical protein
MTTDAAHIPHIPTLRPFGIAVWQHSGGTVGTVTHQRPPRMWCKKVCTAPHISFWYEPSTRRTPTVVIAASASQGFGAVTAVFVGLSFSVNSGGAMPGSVRFRCARSTSRGSSALCGLAAVPRATTGSHLCLFPRRLTTTQPGAIQRGCGAPNACALPFPQWRRFCTCSRQSR